MQPEIAVLHSLQQAAAVLDPARLRVLEALRTPGSAADVARTLGVPRQRLGYHVRALEKAGLLELVEERRKGGTLQRLLRATARTYVVSPEALGVLGAGRAEVQDAFSTASLLAAAARTLGQVAALQRRAREAGKKLPTLTLETEVAFATQADQAAFAKELVRTVAALAVKYHRADAPGARSFRFTVGGHPAVPSPPPPSENPP